MTAADNSRRPDDRRPGPPPERESPREPNARDRVGRTRQRHSVRRRRARPHPLPILVALLVVVLAAGAIALLAPRGRAAAAPVQASSTAAGSSAASGSASWSAAGVWSSITSGAASAVDTPAAAPTPAFASFRGVQILLPVPVADITVIAFHQTSYNDSYQMKPLVRIVSSSYAQAAATTERTNGQLGEAVPDPAANANGVWAGWGLDLWRSGVAGARDTALDCGAKPGTPVLSPVTGTVMRIRTYMLYSRYPDIEIQIKPDDWNDVDVFVLHVTAPVVAEGARVVAGVRQIASVRKLTGEVPGLQLRTYTPEGGDHTHVQINRIPHPGQTWVLGQDPPGMRRVSD
jgi:hypothetical protein